MVIISQWCVKFSKDGVAVSDSIAWVRAWGHPLCTVNNALVVAVSMYSMPFQ